MGTKPPTPKEKDARQGPSENSGSVAATEKQLNTAQTAACQVAEAENKSFVAAEAAKEVERIVKMSEDTDSMLQIVKFIHYQCKLLYFCGYAMLLLILSLMIPVLWK